MSLLVASQWLGPVAVLPVLYSRAVDEPGTVTGTVEVVPLTPAMVFSFCEEAYLGLVEYCLTKA